MADDALPLSRRELIGAGTAIAAFSPLSARAMTRAPVHLIAGTYSAEKGRGLYPVAFTPHNDGLAVKEPIATIANASFGVRSRRNGLFYLLDENARGKLAIWRAGPDWHRVGLVDTAGADPCHAALDATGRCLAIANYSSGNIAFYTLDTTTGLPIGPAIVRTNSGHGSNADRQSAPHAHWVGFAPGNRWLHSVDLGTDQILSYAFDARGGTIGPAFTAYRAPAGSGPRHLAFHPTHSTAYVVSELTNTITLLDRLPDGRFTAEQTLSTLPADFEGHSYAAHIALNRAGTRLYASNRGHDSLAVFGLDTNGRLSLLQHVATQGSWPRFFLLLEDHRRLVVANERTGTITTFHIAPDGRLAPTNMHATVPGVVFLMGVAP